MAIEQVSQAKANVRVRTLNGESSSLSTVQTDFAYWLCVSNPDILNNTGLECTDYI